MSFSPEYGPAIAGGVYLAFGILLDRISEWRFRREMERLGREDEKRKAWQTRL